MEYVTLIAFYHNISVFTPEFSSITLFRQNTTQIYARLEQFILKSKEEFRGHIKIKHCGDKD